MFSRCVACCSSTLWLPQAAGGQLHRTFVIVFFQAEDGIRDLVRSRGLGDVYKRQHDYLSFFERESDERKKFLYPPYYRLIFLEIAHKNLSLIHI